MTPIKYEDFDYSKHPPEIIKGFVEIYLDKALEQPSFDSCIQFLKVPETIINNYPFVISKIHNRYGIVKQTTEEELVSKTLDKALKALEMIDENKLRNSSAKDLAAIASLLIEKHRLMNNKSTENVAISQLSQLISSLDTPFVPKDATKS